MVMDFLLHDIFFIPPQISCMMCNKISLFTRPVVGPGIFDTFLERYVDL